MIFELWQDWTTADAGKSSTVEERVRRLLADQRVGASGIFAVSFTRASARDLRRRVTWRREDERARQDERDARDDVQAQHAALQHRDELQQPARLQPSSRPRRDRLRKAMRLRSSLYRSARVLGDVKAVASGDPKQITRRAKNKLLGRALGRAGIWRRLWL
jgi:UvrD/REP helicase N-terminal domain